ncbi:MAG: hypothetical protein ACM3S0_02595 [Acidobacteriota bacterium]
MAVILAYVPDLMFGTRIEDTAKRLGHTIQPLEPGQDPDAAVARLVPALVIVALDAPEWDRTVKAARTAGARVIAFGSHKNVELMRAAKNAGCDEVLARSRLAAELPALLSRYTGA